MASLTESLVALLRADPTLADLLPGGVWNRPIRSGGHAAATPMAFTGTGSASVIRPCASVQPGPVETNLGGSPAGSFRSLTIWLYETIGSRVTIDAAKARLVALLDGQAVPTTTEGNVVLAFADDLGYGMDDTLLAEVEQVRFRAASSLGRRP